MSNLCSETFRGQHANTPVALAKTRIHQSTRWSVLTVKGNAKKQAIEIVSAHTTIIHVLYFWAKSYGFRVMFENDIQQGHNFFEPLLLNVHIQLDSL